MSTTARVAAGVPTGGQFASHDRADGDAELAPFVAADLREQLAAEFEACPCRIWGANGDVQEGPLRECPEHGDHASRHYGPMMAHLMRNLDVDVNLDEAAWREAMVEQLRQVCACGSEFEAWTGDPAPSQDCPQHGEQHAAEYRDWAIELVQRGATSSERDEPIDELLPF